MQAMDILSMPDSWEYPWFAAWDLAYHCMVLAQLDVDFAKDQIELLLSHRYDLQAEAESEQAKKVG